MTLRPVLRHLAACGIALIGTATALAEPAATLPVDVVEPTNAQLSPEFAPRADQDDRRMRFTLGLDVSNFMIPANSITGVGATFDFHYVLSDRFAVSGGLGLAIGPTSGFSFVYTSFGVRGYYAFSGSLASGRRRVSFQDKTIATVDTPLEVAWGASLGVEEFLLNGASGLYPAPGFSGGVFNRRSLFGQSCNLELRYGMYTASGISFGGILFRFAIFLN